MKVNHLKPSAKALDVGSGSGMVGEFFRVFKICERMVSRVHVFHHKMGLYFSSKSSRTPKTQPNDALRRRLVEFLVFNSAFGRHRH